MLTCVLCNHQKDKNEFITKRMQVSTICNRCQEIRHPKCMHNIERYYCKKCCNDPIKLLVKNMYNGSKTADKRANRDIETNYIDQSFLHNLLEEHKNCYHCQIPLQYIDFNKDLATIQRLNNNIGHSKDNCVIACHSCNVKKVESKINI